MANHREKRTDGKKSSRGTADDTPVVRLQAVQARLAEHLHTLNRPADSVQIIAVSKMFPPDAIAPLLQAGHRLFGENRVQEAQHKWPALQEAFPDVRLHLVGALQSNKAAQAVALFDAIHSLDRLKLARTLADEINRQGRQPQLFVQVNTGGEAQKGGVLPAQLDDFLNQCRRHYGLNIAGLMCLPPVQAVIAPHFALLEKYARQYGLTELSMGMSGDYEAALPFGATHIRLGTAIFGRRPPSPA